MSDSNGSATPSDILGPHLEYTCIMGAASPIGQACAEFFRDEPLILWDPTWASRPARLEHAIGLERRIEICYENAHLDHLTRALDLFSPRYRHALPVNPWRIKRLIWAGEHAVRVAPDNGVDMHQRLDRRLMRPLALAQAVVRRMVLQQEQRHEILVFIPALQQPRGEGGRYLPDPRPRDPRLLPFMLEVDARTRFVQSVGATAGLHAAVSQVKIPDHLYGLLAVAPYPPAQNGLRTSQPPTANGAMGKKALPEVFATLAKQKMGDCTTQLTLDI